MSISSIQVKRRPFVSQNGWVNPSNIISPKTTEVNCPVEDASGKTRYIPSLQELVFDIYDAQREIISSITPKRFKSKIPLPVKAVERIYHHNPNMVSFDGMTHGQALEHFRIEANKIGIRNEFCIPFIFANKICVRSHAFSKGYAYVFEVIDGLRYQTVGTTQEFFWLSNNRQILSNLSFYLNQKYNCNLHIALDEAMRSELFTGTPIVHNRHLYTRACDYYTNPRLMSITMFMRAQIKQLRELDEETLFFYIEQTDELISTDPILAYEVDKAKAIYFGRIKNWIGDFSHELDD